MFVDLERKLNNFIKYRVTSINTREHHKQKSNIKMYTERFRSRVQYLRRLLGRSFGEENVIFSDRHCIRVRRFHVYVAFVIIIVGF
jgi:hypothetical protein